MSKMMFSIFVVFALSASNLVSGNEVVFSESFDGDGPFSDVAEIISTGFDNPDWNLNGFGSDPGTLSNGGYSTGELFSNEGTIRHTLSRDYSLASASFIERIDLKDLMMEPSPGSSPSVHVFHNIGNGFSRIGYVPRFSIDEPSFSISMSSGGDSVRHFIHPTSMNISFEIVFHAEINMVEFRFDNDTSDGNPPMSYELLDFEGLPSDNHKSSIEITSPVSSFLKATIDHWSLRRLKLGDFDYDGMLDVPDIDILSAVVLEGRNDTRRDLNADGLVNSDDRNIWVSELAKTYFGDSNLDGEFNTKDLVNVFQAGEYEDAIEGNSTWATGDWNGDGDFTTSDLTLAFQDGGYELGPREAVQAVPESIPGRAAFAIACLPFLVRRRM